MVANPLVGVLFHWTGGLASGSFYVPFRGVRRWSWETAWLAAGVFSWVIAPWLFALTLSHDLIAVLVQSCTHESGAVLSTYAFGFLWGLGGLTFGLTMRYLGLSLGTAAALGYCSAFGTLVPPITQGTAHKMLLDTSAGNIVLLGILICFTGIVVAGCAGMLKERGMTQEEKRETVKEFSFWKGLAIATFCGIMSACMAFGFNAGGPIKALSAAHGTSSQFSALPVLVVILAGGFTSNAIWCMILNLRNRSAGEFFSSQTLRQTSAGYLNETGASSGTATTLGTEVPLMANYLFSALAGVVWYLQFFFYSIGESMMGKYSFTSWTLHMASIIIFGSLWGLGLGEWRGASPRAMGLLIAAISILVISTVVIGWGNHLAQPAAGH